MKRKKGEDPPPAKKFRPWLTPPSEDPQPSTSTPPPQPSSKSPKKRFNDGDLPPAKKIRIVRPWLVPSPTKPRPSTSNLQPQPTPPQQSSKSPKKIVMKCENPYLGYRKKVW